ncbi:MAG: T9SS type A sorting domain-containing protein [Crocinitomicaceae bacterium]|nr:MAG: T9SS type A sorting domain-containing protein [Crocinitomicaceae bacterium]
MKKTLLTLALAFAGFGANSQVIFSVEEPASIAGGYSLTYAAITDWAVPDMTITANAVLDTVKLAEDTSPTADSLMCLGATPGSLAGKIALLYRGTCNFSVKAKNAQDAGAIAVIIVNNISGEPVGMAGGTEGLNVTIPVVMVSDVTGALIKARLKAGETVVAFIGNKENYYENDLGTNFSKILTAPAQAIPLEVAQNATEFPVNLGVVVFNYGSVLQTGATVTAEVKYNGTSIYNETSAAINFVAGSATEDSVVVTFPPFAPTSYQAGEYAITYTLTPSVTDDYPADNTITTKFVMTDNVYSLAQVDEDGLPAISSGSKPNPQNGNFTTCIHFQNANGSRIGAQGVYFGALKNAADGAITGEEFLIQGFKWNADFVDMNDANFDLSDAILEELGSGSYTFDGDYQDSTLYQAFDTPFMMEDDQRYLFCVTTTSTTVFLAYDTETKYDQLDLLNPQPIGPIKNGDTWSIGFEGNPVPAMGVKTFLAAEAGIMETNTVQASVFPNPAKDQVNVVINGFNGDAVMTVTDLAGKTVMNQTITINENGQAKVNTASLTNGMYLFNLEMANGTVSKFNVVVNK